MAMSRAHSFFIFLYFLYKVNNFFFFSFFLWCTNKKNQKQSMTKLDMPAEGGLDWDLSNKNELEAPRKIRNI